MDTCNKSVNHVATGALDHEFSPSHEVAALCGGIAPSRERSFTCSTHRLFSFFLGGGGVGLVGTRKSESLSHCTKRE